jgi:hypothetical protein
VDIPGLETFIANRLTAKGLTEGEARRFAKLDWVKQMARDVVAGKPLPPGLSNLGPKDVQTFRDRAASTGVPMEQIFRSQFFGSTTTKAGDPTLQLPLGRGEAAPPVPTANPMRAATPPPPSSSGPLEMLDNKVSANENKARADEIGSNRPMQSYPGRPPGYEGTHHSWMVDAPQGSRKPYALTAKDISPQSLDIIAREAQRNNQSIDAVIDNALNRIGGTGYSGKTDSLHSVLTAPGQYEAHDFLQSGRFKPATEEHRQQVLGRLQSKALGQLPDITEGATTYRAESYVEGKGRNKTFARAAREGNWPTIGGNVYGTDPGMTLGPYAATGKPYDLSQPETVPSLDGRPGISDDGFSITASDFGGGPAPAVPSAIASTGSRRAAPSATAAFAVAPPAELPPPPARNPNMPTYGASQGRTGVGGPTIQRIAEAYAASAGRTGVGGDTRMSPPPPMPGRNPLRVPPSLSAFGTAGRAGAPPGASVSVDAGRVTLPQMAQAYASQGRAGASATVDATPIPLPTRNPLRDTSALRAYGSTGMAHSMPFATSASPIRPGISATGSVGVPNGGLPAAPAYARAELNTSSHPKNVFLGGSSSHPKNVFPPIAPQSVPVLSGTPGVSSHPKNGLPGSRMPEGIRPTIGSNIPLMPLPSGLGMNPFTAMTLSRNQQPQTLQATVQSLAQSAPPVPLRRPTPPTVTSPMAAPQAAARARPGISPAAPIAPMAPAPKPEGMGVLGPSFGGGHSPATSPTRSAFSGMTPSQAQGDIAKAHMRAAAELHASAQRVQQGFLVNRATMQANMERRRLPLGSTRGQQSYIRSPINTGYGYL